MKNNRISVSTNINIFRFLIIILGYFKLFIILNFITIIITLIISKGVLFSIVFEYFLVFFFGLIMSTYIHEYARTNA